MNAAAAIMKLHLKGRYTWWFFVPWAVVASSFALNLVIGLLVGGYTEIRSGGLASFFAMMFVTGVMAVKEMFPFALGMSRRRTDFFLGTAATVLLTSAISAVGLYLLWVIERATGFWGINLHFFAFPSMDHFTAVGLMAVFFILSVHMCFLGLACTSVCCRFGTPGLVTLIVAMLAFLTGGAALCTVFGWWEPIFMWLARHYLELFWWMAPAAAVYALASFLLLRKATA